MTKSKSELTPSQWWKSLQWDVFRWVTTQLGHKHVIWSCPRHAHYIPVGGPTNCLNRKTPQELFYLLNPLKNGTLAYRWQASGFGKAQEQEPHTSFGQLGTGKWKARGRGQRLIYCCWWPPFNVITFDPLLFDIWISLSPNSQGFPTKTSWQITPHGERQVARWGEKKNGKKLCKRRKKNLLQSLV